MQPAVTMLPKLSDTTQTISFSDSDGVSSVEVIANDVVVTTNAGTHNQGSSKVKLKNVVDYNWEHRFYTGQLLAIHMSGKYLAYAIKVGSGAPGTWNSMIRVAHRGADKRSLIKGMKGEVQDLAFAHIDSPVQLASIDEHGNIYIHHIELLDDGLKCTLTLEVLEDTGLIGASHRVVWCPYIPDEDDDVADNDVAHFLVTTHGNTARMWNVKQVLSNVTGTSEGARALLAGGGGVLAANEHTAPLVDAAFSPDGTALATASADGYVMFFQVSMVYMHNESTPRCLHKWQPHGGHPLSCLFFLDNHKSFNFDVQFWKFAVTGAENNTNIKIWSCKSWICLQTITFAPQLGPDLPTDNNLILKAVLDAGASYLVLSDFKRKSLYVLQMARDSEDSMAYCKSISEFLLPYPVLSFGIIDAGEQVVKCISGCGEPYHRNGNSTDIATPDHFDIHPDELEDEPELRMNGSSEGGIQQCVTKALVRLYIVQPKSLQEARLLFTPPPTQQELARLHGMDDLTLDDVETAQLAEEPMKVNTILQQQSQQLKNLLMRAQTQPGSLIAQRPESPTSVIAPQLNLMTPDAFSSPGKREEDDPPLSATPDVPSVHSEAHSTHILPNAPSAAFIIEEQSTPREPKLTSGGSSPSREVQEIFSHEPAYYKHEIEDEASQSPETTTVVEDGSGTDTVYASPEKPTQSSLSVDKETIWPEKPPPPSINSNEKETKWPALTMAHINEANQRKASSDKSSNQSINNSLNVSNIVDISLNENIDSNSEIANRIEQLSLSLKDKARLDAIEDKLDKLTELVYEQNHMLRQVRGSMASPDTNGMLMLHTEHTVAAIDQALGAGWERVVASSAAAATAAGEAAGAAAARAAGAGAARALEPLAHALQNELATKLTATDQLLSDNIQKLVNSKSVVESIGTAVARALTGTLRESFRDALTQTLLPSMEKAHQQVFKQINAAFQNGTKEFAANTEAAARAAAERGGAAAAASLRAALERHADALATAAPATTHLVPVLHDAVRGVLEQEMGRWREQAASVLEASRSHSPANTSMSHASHAAIDRQLQVSQITSLIGAGDVNGAFQVALSASDLSLVVHACRAADPARVFSPTCRLKQHVLMSLVQQLAADMAHDTQLKHRYLEEAVMNLDPNNPVTREHMPVVIRELQKQLSTFIASNPSHALGRQLKMLLMATESLVKSSV